MISGARCAKRLRLAKHSTPIASTSSVTVTRVIHTSSPRRITFALPVNDAAQSSKPPVVDFRQRIVEQKYRDLDLALEQSPPSYTRTWGCYVELINFVGLYEIPLETHQKALRGCTANADYARAEYAKRFTNGGSPFAPHQHEYRFKAIIQNMRQAGHTPELEDYHFILQQFAAVGYHYGAVRVLREISHVGLLPSPKSYGLCLQALCHRLALPCGHDYKEKALAEAVTICNDLTQQMHTRGVPFTPANVDLIYRVLKHTMDMSTLENMLKVAYGVDLSYPDRPPLEFWQPNDSSSGLTSVNPAGLTAPLNFSTSALNTTLNVLGRLKEISKLVQTFEVLTTPFPSRSATQPSSTFEDDEDDDFGVNSPAVASFPLPYAEPNTYTYETLLMHVSQAPNFVLARHYLQQAITLDRKLSHQLRRQCSSPEPPLEHLYPPRVSTTRRMFLSVAGLANTLKKMELLRWVHVKARKMARLKAADIRYYTKVRDRWSEAGVLSSPIPEAASGGHQSSPLTTSSSPSSVPSSSGTQPESKAPFKMPHFQVDLDSLAPPPPHRRRKFDIERHLALLERERDQILDLATHLEDVIGRNTQRIKERLGRRVWGRKTVYLRFTGRRQLMQPAEWVEKVNFRTTRVVEDGVGSKPPDRRRKSQRMGDDFFTSSVPRQGNQR